MKKILLLIMIVSTSFAFSQRTASVTGNWNDTATWGGQSVPDLSTDVTVNNGVFLTVNVSAVCNSIDASSGSFLQIDADLSISGGSSTSSTFSGTTNADANVTLSESNFTNSGTFTVSPGKQIIFSNSSSTITNTGSFKLNSTNLLYSSLLYKGTSFNGTGGTFQYARAVSNAATWWDHVGSPVSGQTAGNIITQGEIATNGSQFGIGTFDNTTGADGTWTLFTTAQAFVEGSLESGVGYIMGSDNGSSILFDGDLVTDAVNINITEGDSQGDAASVTGSRWNLLANPYPAYLSVNSAAASASSYGSDYLMKTANLAVLHANNKNIYVNNGSGYTTITNLTAAANAVIAPGQGFFVGGLHGDSGAFNFNTSMITEDDQMMQLQDLIMVSQLILMTQIELNYFLVIIKMI
jgi:hypothetical protein